MLIITTRDKAKAVTATSIRQNQLWCGYVRELYRL